MVSVSPDQLERSRKYFQKYGLWSLLLAWVPIIGDPLTLLAGVLKVRFGIFFVLVSISKISRYVFILYLASFRWMKKIITLEVGNSSWWKNRKYRREAAQEIREMRKKGFQVKFLKKYQLGANNTIVYGDYLLKTK
jgi:uncharacterized membrane protein YdjX (TVP38/TMEM64 family)